MLLLLALLATARLEATTDGQVLLSYSVEIPEGATHLSFSALETVPIEELTAMSSGERLVLTEERSGERLSGAVSLPPGARSRFALDFHYRVHGPRIPVLILDVAPGEARSGAFTARVELPDGAEASPDFPSNGVRDGASALTWELPVLPAFVSWGRAPGVRGGARPPLTFWGLFAVNAAIALLYAVWMRRAP